MLVLQSSDAKTRFEVIERYATPAGKFYARAGLFTLGWSPDALARLGPLSGTVRTISGDIGGSENAQAYFDRSVLNGWFMRVISEFIPKKVVVEGTRSRAVREAKLESATAVRAPVPVGRVLGDEAEWLVLSDWSFEAK